MKFSIFASKNLCVLNREVFVMIAVYEFPVVVQDYQ